MKNQFLTLDWGQIHYRVLGSGRPIILLHASPSSGKMLLPLAQQLAEDHLIIIPDTPGYGLSDAIPVATPKLIDYAEVLRQFADGLGLQTFCLYGTATGAQLAIRYAIRFPEQVEHVFLDNAAHFSDEQRNAILQDYFPNLHPTSTGDHLPKLWQMVHGLFTHFPWCWTTKEYRLSNPIPGPVILQFITLDYLQAGPSYDRAYRAAFQHEKAENVQKLKVPTSIFRWEGSILRSYIDALLAHDFATNIKSVPIVANPQERLVEMAAHIREKTASLPAFEILKDDLPANRLQQTYWSTPIGNLHGWREPKGGKVITVVFHDWGSSAAVSRRCYSANSSTWFVSLPGHGESTSWHKETNERNILEGLHLWLNSYGDHKFQLTGMGWGWQLAQALNQIGNYVLEEEIPCPWQQTPSPPAPTENGAHLLDHWQAWKTSLLTKTMKTTKEGQLDLLTICFLESWKFKKPTFNKPDLL